MKDVFYKSLSAQDICDVSTKISREYEKARQHEPKSEEEAVIERVRAKTEEVFDALQVWHMHGNANEKFYLFNEPYSPNMENDPDGSGHIQFVFQRTLVRNVSIKLKELLVLQQDAIVMCFPDWEISATFSQKNPHYDFF